MGDWQPIETAPKDGRKFGAWCVSDQGAGGARFPDVQMRGDGSGFGYVVHLRNGVAWQYLDARGQDSIFPKWVPTHWMPLPEPPHA